MKKQMKMNRKIVYYLLLILFGLPVMISCSIGDRREVINSPDGKVGVTVETLNSQLYYSVTYEDKKIIHKSKLGLKFKGNASLGSQAKLIDVQRNSEHSTWEQVWGEKRFVENRYEELVLNFEENSNPVRKYAVYFRVFNDGLGFRYTVSNQPGLDSLPALMDELTQFRMDAVKEVWWIPAYKEKFYESKYRHTGIAEIDTVCTPLTMLLNNGTYVSIHEANLTDYAAMNLFLTDENMLNCDLTPWSTGEKVRPALPFITPWRTLVIGENPGDLMTSCLMLNLNEPCKIEDTSWIEPGKYIGIWWGMHQDKYTWAPGPKHGATTENAKKYIDFAAANNFEGVLVEGWNYGWEGDWTANGHKFSFTESYPDFDIEAVSRYAREKNVRLIGHHETGGATINYEKQMEEAFQLYQALGVNAVKTGYVSEKLDGKEYHSSQYGVRHYRKVIETAARYHIMIDNHEPVMPTGLQRTYPNLMTQEGVRGQEWDAWSVDGGNTPDHTTIVPFTRGLAGPMDFTFGTFNFANPKLPDTRVQTTLAKQVALYMIIYSPLQMASDLPENYVQNDAFNFIKNVPVNWEDTRVLDAVIGDYVLIARKDRASEDWYVGAITDEEARTLTLDLSFLKKSTKYIAEIIADGDQADWKDNPYDFTYKSMDVYASDKLTIQLAKGGGQAIRLVSIKD